MPKTSLFFRPSKKLAHIHDKMHQEQKLERIKIAAGLRTREQIENQKGTWNLHLDPSKSSQVKYFHTFPKALSYSPFCGKTHKRPS